MRRFTVRPLDQRGAWATDHRRYYHSAEAALTELISLAEEVVRRWPAGADEILPRDQQPEGLYELCRQRERASDAVLLFAAIAVEGFVNFYGVVRLGETQFNRHFERLPIQRKAELLLLVCDGVVLESDDELLAALAVLTAGRNRLAHPKAREVPEDRLTAPHRIGLFPDDAQDAVANMKRFFDRFANLVPGSQLLMPRTHGA